MVLLISHKGHGHTSALALSQPHCNRDHLYRSLLPLESRYSNVYLARDRLATIWGGSSRLEMLLRGMAYLLRRHPGWDYFVNLSETDYPVK
ncbi:hypothetical protein MRX96_042710 [Rhipicephalus microplus]